MTQVDTFRITTMLATNAYFQARSSLAAFFNGHEDQLTGFQGRWRIDR